MFESMLELAPESLVAVVESTMREESMLIARRLAAVAALLQDRLEAQAAAEERGYASIDGYLRTSAEVAAAMNLSPSAASYVVGHAEALDVRLPKVFALLAQGRTDWSTVQVIITRTEYVSDSEVIAKLDESLSQRIGGWTTWSKRRITNAVDGAVCELDRDAIRERAAADQGRRYIATRPLPNGMAEVKGKVTAVAATAFDQRLSALAKQVCADDPRTMDQRRADALEALSEGRSLACACDQPECPMKADQTDTEGGVKVVINVIATDATVAGSSEAPGYLQGYGVIDAEQVRELVATAAQQLINPYTSPVAALRYQPSAALQRAVRCRDLTCRFPGCDRPAMRCDLDHTVPFNHENPAAGGPTVFEDLKCLCRQHHILKTFGGWRDQQLADGTVVWTSPTGRVYRTAPVGVDLFPELARPACAPPPPKRRSRSKERASRIARVRKHNREQRPINEQRRWFEQQRKSEIEDRKFRNHMRDMRVLFHGSTPSTNPRCQWINESREPEDLPSDWQPGESFPEPLPDEPPF